MNSFGNHLRLSSSLPSSEDGPVSWTIALAGGEGTRLADYVEHRFGRRLPKQFCPLLGQRSMLQHTLLRTNKLSPASRTLTVVAADQAGLALPQVAGLSDHVFRQPSSQDTGVAFYVALAMIKHWAPHAVVTVTPTDHYVAPGDAYVQAVRIASSVAKDSHRIVMLGVEPTGPDPELGYLVLGAALSEVPRARKLVRFVEKPTRDEAKTLVAGGALWNTLLMCGTVDTFWRLGAAAAPDFLELIDSLVPQVGTAAEAAAIEHVYRVSRPVNLSSEILERGPEMLAAMQLDGVEWSDWGKPERIERTLAQRTARERADRASQRVDRR